MSTQTADVVVLGAGPAGYVCAIRLAQLGRKVTVVSEAAKSEAAKNETTKKSAGSAQATPTAPR